MRARAAARQVGIGLYEGGIGGGVGGGAAHAASGLAGGFMSWPMCCRANCWATRPLREPRSSAHTSAWGRAASICAALAPSAASHWAAMRRYSSWLKGLEIVIEKQEDYTRC